MASWYLGWAGKKGSLYHRKAAIPTVLELSAPAPGERLLDLGCGQGVLAPHVLARGAAYVGVDASGTLIGHARQFHTAGGAQRALFLRGDARELTSLPELQAASFDAAVFMLSLQDMDPLEAALGSASWALKGQGRLVIFLIHPCFRVPRGSGWGFDPARKLRYRRIDSYLSERAVPMKAYAEVSSRPQGSTLSFHRPLSRYVNTLSALGLGVERLEELPDPLASADAGGAEIPLFAAIRARKL